MFSDRPALNLGGTNVRLLLLAERCSVTPLKRVCCFFFVARPVRTLYVCSTHVDSGITQTLGRQ